MFRDYSVTHYTLFVELFSEPCLVWHLSWGWHLMSIWDICLWASKLDRQSYNGAVWKSWKSFRYIFTAYTVKQIKIKTQKKQPHTHTLTHTHTHTHTFLLLMESEQAYSRKTFLCCCRFLQERSSDVFQSLKKFLRLFLWVTVQEP